MDNRFAVIDLGSNTFHILIVDINEDGTYQQVHKEGSFVGLAERGIEKIGEQAISRGMETLEVFSKLLIKYNVNNYRAIGTSALRTASNGKFFTEKAAAQLNLKIEVIDGGREAELIYKGVTAISDTKSGTHVIMDIGGGSVEFILIEKNELAWSKSYDIGVGVLYNLVEKMEDPIGRGNIEELNSFLNDQLSDLRELVLNKQIDSMIGASGSFEIIQSINGDEVKLYEQSEIELSKFVEISKIIKPSSRSQREKINGLPASRSKLIVVAFLLLDKAIEIINPSKLIVSPFALKQGVLSEWPFDKK